MRRYSEIEHLLKLTLAVYRVTDLFPEEQLRDQTRESANKILADLLLNRGESAPRLIEQLTEFFNLAGSKNWVDSRNFLVLKKEYDKIRQSLGVGKNSGKGVENSFSKNGQNNHRQEKILEMINGNGKIKIGDLVKFFPEINRRTVLRDLAKLCQAGVAVRNGNGRGVHYTKNGHKCDMS